MLELADFSPVKQREELKIVPRTVYPTVIKMLNNENTVGVKQHLT